MKRRNDDIDIDEAREELKRLEGLKSWLEWLLGQSDEKEAPRIRGWIMEVLRRMAELMKIVPANDNDSNDQEL